MQFRYLRYPQSLYLRFHLQRLLHHHHLQHKLLQNHLSFRHYYLVLQYQYRHLL